ncbi:MAG: aminopeptidase, partial [Bacteroidetes bacterium]|nr:aminopeptidase [Bacteroidota bacterium]
MALGLVGCPGKGHEAKTPATPVPSIPVMHNDPHSYAKPEISRVAHLHLDLSIDFDAKTLSGTATWDIVHTDDAGETVFDTKGLTIEEVWLDQGLPATWKLGNEDPILGAPLTVDIGRHTKSISIRYRTAPGAEALMWLDPSQTQGKEHPFLFTQSQAILARTWLPCQDGPGLRYTYRAQVQAPVGLMVAMSATNPVVTSPTGRYSFEMKQPVPSYLMALVCGNLVFSPIGNRTGVYAEPELIEAAAYELGDMESMLETAETLYGPYAWERYDVVFLPPSFPFGGMENPRLTFATPTIITGDRSLTALIAHELAHSWSGNLVTNATWDDFWLNEGFTVYFEQRIMEALYGREYSEMLALLSYQGLLDELEDFELHGAIEDTHLKLHLQGRDPDDGLSAIAYDKG